MLPEIERIGFGVKADEDEYPEFFTHSDRFLIVDLKRRKEVVLREYRPNPYVATCKEKYGRKALELYYGEDEELEIYRQIAEIVKDCKYVGGKNFGYYVKMALEKAGTGPMMMNYENPQEWIDSLIEERALAGYTD
jgi:predicted Fe-Mo cluster-binding NifX family protein